MKRSIVLLCALMMVASASAQESLPPGTKVVKIEAKPAAIDLKHPYDYRQVLLTGVLDNGDRLDVTRMAVIEPPAKIIKLSERGLVRPLANGAGDIQYKLGELSGKIPVTVAGLEQPHQVSFTREVMPVISRLGCNAGTCHGSAQGKNGFQLSLRGYDPVMDHRALIDDIAGRRFNRAVPERSLMLMKTSGAVAHVGGVLTNPGEPSYELIRNWIIQGVKLDGDGPKVVRLEVFPNNPILPLAGAKQQMLVTAFYSDGVQRDVTAEAFIDSSNPEVATVDKQSLITAVRRGETAMLARYEGNYAAATVIVMGDRSGFAWKETPEFNWIDGLVYDKLKQVRVLPSDVCTDSEFIRRLHLDLTGLPPGPEEVKKFLADAKPSKQKREELVEQLLGSPDFVDHWTNKWADLLQVNRKFLGVPGATAFRSYIREAVAKNNPYDKFCFELLTATGSNIDNPAASYFKILREPVDAMENTTHLFLGVRFNCNKCHDHPFERWTMNQYYTLSAYFAQINRAPDPKFKGQNTEGTAVRGPLPLVEIITDKKSGDITNERTGGPAIPKFPYDHATMPDTKLDRRMQLAQWITSKDNPYFAKSYVNRVWSYLLGVGLIEPIDDLRAGNPPTNPKLLDKLTEEFIKSGFDVQRLIRTICTSRTYQHSYVTNKWNQDDEQNYSHALARRLPAEVLYDAIHRATGSTSRLPGLPPGSRAVQLVDSNVPIPGSFLELFGRPSRESACECERTNSMLLGPVLNLVNGPVLADALKDPASRINQLAAKEKNDANLVREIYMSIWCRYPSAKELETGLQALKGAEGDYKELLTEKDKRKADLDAHEKKLPQLQAAWEAGVTRTPIWTVLQPAETKAAAGAVLTAQKDGSILASGPNNSPETYTVKAHTDLVGITGVRLEVLAEGTLPAKGPGRAPNGNFVLNEFKVDFIKKDSKDKPAAVKLTRPQATFSQDTFSIDKVLDNNPATGWAIAPQFGKNQTAVFEVQNKFGVKEGTTLTFTLSQQFAGKDHNIGKFRLSVTSAKAPILLQGATPENITRLLDVESDKRTAEQKTALTNYYRSIDPELQRLQRAFNEYVVPENPRAMGAQDLAWVLLNSPAFLFNH